jgi:uncharacterized protein YkwD
MFSQSSNFQSAGSSLLTTDASNGFLTTNRSMLRDPLMADNSLRVSSASLSAAATTDPGNTLGSALDLGTLSKTPINRSDFVGSTDRNDYYRFSVSATTDFNLTLNGMSANAGVQLLGSNGSILNTSNREGTANETINRTLNPGTYYVRVYQSNGNTNYTLNLADVTPAPTPTPTPTPAPAPMSDFVQRVLDLTNQFRAQNGVAPLQLNVELNAAALNHSTDMALRDYFSHTGSDGSSAGDRMRQAGYVSNAWGENIAAGYATPEQVVQGWINSPGHRANMLNPSYTELGVGYYQLTNDTGNVNYTNYWTQDFGSGDTNPATNLPA